MQQAFFELKFSGKLPSPAGVGMEILQLTQQEYCGLDDIAKVVRSDPSLAGRVLKVANSFTASGADPAVPLDEAVLRIGFASLRNLVLGFSLIPTHPEATCRGFDYAAFWHTSLGRAVSAQYLAEKSGRGGGSESYVCGLLCDIGRLGLASVHPDRYGLLLHQPDTSDRENLISLESREFGIDHRQLTEALLLDWGFPAPLAHAAANYQQSNETDITEPASLCSLREILRASDELVAAVDAEAASTQDLSAQLIAALLSLDILETEIAFSLRSITSTWKEWGKLLKVGPRRAAVTRGVAGSASSTCVTSPPGARRKDDLAGACEINRPKLSPSTPLLLLDGQDRSASGFESWLKPAGYTVIRARCVREALDLAVAEAPPIVIARGGVNDADALEFCGRLRSFEEGRKTFFILATSNADPERLLTTFEAGVDDHLITPVTAGAGLLRLRAAQRFVEMRARLSEQERTLQQNLADLAVANRKLHRAAMTDELTHLPNRRFAEETLREAWHSACLQDEPLSLIMGDIDRFKAVNDDFGHLVGDAVLVAVARVLSRELRASDIACRVGGEEFLIICPRTDLQGARICAERLRERVEMCEISASGVPSGVRPRVTISLGVASRRQGKRVVETAEALLKAADDAAYASKRAGRNLVSVAA